jgi:hypothetical protein
MNDNRDDLWAILESRDAALAQLRTGIAELRAALDERDALVRELHRAAGEAQERERTLVGEVQAKEAVIDDMRRGLAAYRAAFGPLGFAVRPFARLFAIATRPLVLLRPRLGVLNQHPPCPLRGPAPFAGRLDPSPPTISIVTPSFRQAAFIERTIESVLGQGYPALEYRVQDGGSEDGTRQILERYASRLAGWESAGDSGQSEAINRAFERTSGGIMGWLNSDDLLMPGALARVADHFQRHPRIDVVYGHRILIDEEDREIGRWVLPAHDDAVLSWADFIPQETMFWRRRIWDKVGGRIDESFRFAMDWDLILRFREAGARFERLPFFLGGFRVHAAQKTIAGISDIGFREMARLRERTLGRVPSPSEVRRAVLPYLLRHVMADLAWRVRFRLGGE